MKAEKILGSMDWCCPHCERVDRIPDGFGLQELGNGVVFLCGILKCSACGGGARLSFIPYYLEWGRSNGTASLIDEDGDLVRVYGGAVSKEIVFSSAEKYAASNGSRLIESKQKGGS